MKQKSKWLANSFLVTGVLFLCLFSSQNLVAENADESGAAAKVDPIQAITSDVNPESMICKGALSTNLGELKAGTEKGLNQFTDVVKTRLDQEKPVDDYTREIQSRRDGLGRSQGFMADPIQSLVFDDLKWVMRIVQLIRQGNTGDAKSQLYGLFDPVNLAVRDILIDADAVRKFRALSDGLTVRQKLSWTYAKAWWQTHRLLKRLERNMKTLGRLHFRFALVKDILENTSTVSDANLDYSKLETLSLEESSEPLHIGSSILESLGFNSRVLLELDGKLAPGESTPTDTELGLAFSTRIGGAGEESAKAYMLRHRRLAGVRSVATRFLSQPYLWKIAEVLGSTGVGIHQKLLSSVVASGGKADAVNEVLGSWANTLRMVGKNVWVRNTDIPEIFYIIYAVKPDLTNEKFEQFQQAFNRRGKGFIETFALVNDRDAKVTWSMLLSQASEKDPALHTLMTETAAKIDKEEKENQNFHRLNLFAPQDRISPTVQILAPIGMLAYFNSDKVFDVLNSTMDIATFHAYQLWDYLHFLF